MNPTPLLRAAAPLLLLSLSAASASAAPAPKIDPAALALLQKVQAASLKMHSFSADSSVTTHSRAGDSRHVGTVRFMKPNFGREDSYDLEKNPASGLWKKSNIRTLVSDGKLNWNVHDSQCFQSEDDPQGNSVATNAVGVDFFNTKNSLLSMLQDPKNPVNIVTVTDAGTQSLSGAACRVVEMRRSTSLEHEPKERQAAPGGVILEIDRLYINADAVICRMSMADNIGGSGDAELTNIRVNPPLTPADFQYTPPPGVQIAKASDGPPPSPPLLAAGTPAPDFAATTPDGKQVHLSDFKGKTVVLDFWSTWCPPCQRSMPHLEKVYQSVKDKNVAVLGVCVWDDKPAYDKWVAAKKNTYHFPTAFDPAGHGAGSIASKLYQVSGIPTQYVIDKDGKIAASTVGYNENGTDLEDALKAQGVDVPKEGKTAAARP